MRITLNWLKDFLYLDKIKLEKILDTLNMLGLEVEEIKDRKEELKKYIIAKIINYKQHPQSSKLKICTVQTGENNFKQIICGANNVEKKMNVVFADLGCIVPNNQTVIQKKLIQGVESSGMLCSFSELKIDHVEEIPGEIIKVDNQNAKIGDSIINYFNLDDTIIDISITPDRGDCLSVYGIARELSAMGLSKLKRIDEIKFCNNLLISKNILSKQKKLKKQSINKREIKILDKKLIPFFSLWEIKNVKSFQTPNWIKYRLKNVGIKVFDNTIDAVSFISHSFGYPMHIYDADKISNKISVGRKEQFSHNKNKIKALDEKEYLLDKLDLITCSDDEIISLSGIIGSKYHAVSKNTNNIVIEVGLFNKNSISFTGQRLKINTDARYKFERHVDYNFMKPTALLSINLIHHESKESYLYTQTICNNFIKKDKTISFEEQKIKNICDVKISSEKIKKILMSLGFQIINENRNSYKIIVPSFRSDIETDTDIVREIIRIHGYDNIKSENILINSNNFGGSEKRSNYLFQKIFKLKTILTIKNYTEVYSWSFCDKKGFDLFKKGQQDEIKINNPISEQLSHLRPSIVSNLLNIAYFNQSRSVNKISIFEIGPRFNNKNIEKNSEDLSLCILQTGVRSKTNLYIKNEINKVDFFDVKGVINEIFNQLHVKVEYKRNNFSFAHPKRTLSIIYNNHDLGYIAQIHPKIQNQYKLKNEVIVAEIKIQDIINLAQKKQEVIQIKNDKKNYFYPSIYQEVKRDFCFLVDKEIDVYFCLEKIFAIDKKIIKEVNVFDVFESQDLPKGRKSFTFEVIIQSNTKTLTEEEVNIISQKIINLMMEEINAEIRI